MEETENNELIEQIRISTEKQIEQWESEGIVNEELIKAMSLQAASWCQGIAEMCIPMAPEDRLYAKVEIGQNSLILTVTKNAD